MSFVTSLQNWKIQKSVSYKRNSSAILCGSFSKQFHLIVVRHSRDYLPSDASAGSFVFIYMNSVFFFFFFELCFFFFFF